MALDSQTLRELCLLEGWELTQHGIRVNGENLPLAHPFQVYLKLYREAATPVDKLRYFQRTHDLLWPQMVLTNNAWQERIFKGHCDNWSQIVLAAGAGAGKSLSAAKVALIFWLSDPKRNAVIIS